MASQRKRIRTKTHKRKGKSRVWKTRWVTVHSPSKPAASSEEAAGDSKE